MKKGTHTVSEYEPLLKIYVINWPQWVILLMRLITLTGFCVGWDRSSMVSLQLRIITIYYILLPHFYPWLNLLIF
ncbi:hypothetical protein ACS0TY_011090 [Phlomoides rotata]